MKTDKIIGKVAIKKEELTHQNGKDQWLAITPVDKDSEVQVCCFLEECYNAIQFDSVVRI